MAELIKAPFITIEDSRNYAKNLLVKYGMLENLPVNVERLSELMGLDTVPMHNLEVDFGIHGFLAGNNKEIYADLKTWEMNPRRHRFTIAHELGHLVQHNNIYCELNYSDLCGYESFLEGIPGDVLYWLEKHADNFAGCLLVPTESLINAYNDFLRKDNDALKKKTFQAKEAGLSREMIIDFVADRIAGNLCGIFDVTDTVVKIRLLREDLVKPLLGLPN